MVVGIIVGAGLVLTLLPASHATAVTCHNGGAGWEGDYDGANHRGVKVANPGMDVHNYGNDCQTVRSMYVWQTQNNFVEVGWFENPPDDIPPCDDPTSPHVFVYAIVGGTTKCKHPSDGLSAPDTIGANVQDSNADMTWDYSVDGNGQGSYDTNMTNGEVFAATERHTAGDKLGAEFDGLQYMGASGNWNSWDELHGVKDTATWDNVSDYDFCRHQDDHFSVETSC